MNAAHVNANIEVEAAIENKQDVARIKEKDKKKATPSWKRREASGTRNADDEEVTDEQETEEANRQKRKAKVAQTKDIVLTLDEALSRGNQMFTKTKDNKIDAIYKVLEVGLGHVFPCRKRRLPGMIPLEKLHIAPDLLKYGKIAK